ncbi:MAG: hypothetical protein GOMPHAMPRED_005922 [Gomphillus americanus]|uniref:WD repeat-containing protein n=1 Tax=Gomphillus americanus TaxID=1940652 RepID=A0A8H3FVJ9_9LECA|nr:MAG: hypothetical protein GOMPHAMPRED_005922 [Gomphillus americanus]
MASLGMTDVIDLTKDDSEEEVSKQSNPLVKKKKRKQSLSIHSSPTIGTTGTRKLFIGSVPFYAPAPGVYHEHSSPFRSSASADDRSRTEVTKVGVESISEKKAKEKHSVTDGSFVSTTDGTTNGPKKPKYSQVKDVLQFPNHGDTPTISSLSPSLTPKDRMKVPRQPRRVSTEEKAQSDPNAYKRQNQMHSTQTPRAQDMIDHERSSPTLPYNPRIIPNSHRKTKTNKSKKAMIQKADANFQKTIETAASSVVQPSKHLLADTWLAGHVNDHKVNDGAARATAKAVSFHPTNAKKRQLQDTDVLLYLDRVGIEWVYKENASVPIIVLTRHLAAVRDGLLGDVPNEDFSLKVSSQGELLVARKLKEKLAPSGPSLSNRASLPPTQARDKALASSSKPVSKASDPSELAIQHVPTLTSHVDKLAATMNAKSGTGKLSKRKVGLSNIQLQGQLLSKRQSTDSETNENDGYLTTGSMSEGLRRSSKRAQRSSSSNLQQHGSHVLGQVLHQTHSISIDADQCSLNCFGKEKTRISTYPLHSRGSLLRNRDISGPGWLSIQQSLMRVRDSCLNTTIQPWKNWIGASKDIIRTAWAPDGLSFVIGSSTDLDERNVQFNRPNNLLWCNMTTNTIVELDDHKIQRSVPGILVNLDMTESNRVLDPHVFTTISDICYGQDSTRFWTASYDKTVKVWDVIDESPRCARTVVHQDPVDILARCCAYSTEVVASAQKSTSAGVKIYQYETSLTTSIPDPDQAEKHSLVPTALAWGNPTGSTKSLLAAGYGEKENEAVRHLRGNIVIWNAEAEAKLIDLTSRYHYVYDLAWHTYQPWLAAAIPVKERTHAGLPGTQSNIRIWEPYRNDRYIYDLDCLGLDINRVIFNPMDSVYVSAACTDGIVYHYDLRQPQEILAKFEHSPPISQLYTDRPREIQDFGVQFMSWNAAGTLLYSGSSDGKIKQWNPYLNNENAFIEDIATLDASISSGCFSPDFTNLLIGTNKGSAHVFSSAPVTPWIDDTEDRLRDRQDTEDGEEEKGKRIERSGQNGAASFKYQAARSSVTG